MSKLIPAAILALSLSACGGRHMSPERVEKQLNDSVEDLLDDVDATPAQRTRTAELEKQILTDVLPLMKQGTEARATLVEQWKTPVPDSAKVHSLIDAELDSVRAFTHKLADAAIAFHQLLTPEQRQVVTKRLDRNRR